MKELQTLWLDVERTPNSTEKDMFQTVANMAITLAHIGKALTAVIDQCNRNTEMINQIDTFLSNRIRDDSNSNSPPERLDS